MEREYDLLTPISPDLDVFGKDRVHRRLWMHPPAKFTIPLVDKMPDRAQRCGLAGGLLVGWKHRRIKVQRR